MENSIDLIQKTKFSILKAHVKSKIEDIRKNASHEENSLAKNPNFVIFEDSQSARNDLKR
jgi:hypothetical protein